MISNSDTSGLSTFQPCFWPYQTLNWLVIVLLQTSFTKNRWITKAICPPSQWKKISKRLVLWWSPLTFSWNYYFVIWTDFIYLLVLCLTKINDDTKDQNNCARKTFHTRFWFDWEIFRVELLFMTHSTPFVFLGDFLWLIRWKVFCDSNGGKKCVKRNIPFVVYIW